MFSKVSIMTEMLQYFSVAIDFARRKYNVVLKLHRPETL